MKTKREYEEAFDLIDIFTSCGCNEVDDCNCCIAYNKRLKQQHGCELDLALNMFKELIDEHFELLDRCNELERTIHSLDCELSDAYNPKPYKFEDYGYRKLKKYGVHDIRRGKLIYIGFLRDIKEEFFEDKYTLEHIKKATYSNKLLENRYLIRKDIA